MEGVAAGSRRGQEEVKVEDLNLGLWGASELVDEGLLHLLRLLPVPLL